MQKPEFLQKGVELLRPAPGIPGAPLIPLVNSEFCGGSARHGLAAGAARVSTWVEGSSKGRYLASCG